MSNYKFARVIGKLFNNPTNNEFGLSNVFPYAGVIIAIDTQRFVAAVNTSNGIIQDVKIPIMGYSAQTGIYHKPSVGDYCLVISTAQGESYIVGFYSFNSIKDLEESNRVVPKEHTFVLKTKSGDTINLSIDEETPTITINSPKKLEVKVDSGEKSGIINIESDENKNMVMSLKLTNNDDDENFASINLDQTGIVIQSQDSKIEMKKDTGDIIINDGNSPVVTLDMLLSLISTGAGSFMDGGVSLRTAIETEKVKPNKFKA